MSSFDRWLDTFVSEKQIDMEEPFELDGPSGINYLNYEAVIRAIKMTCEKEQRMIMNMLTKIDFVHGDIRAYLRRLATAIVV
jgi:hypothetical protein